MIATRRNVLAGAGGLAALGLFGGSASAAQLGAVGLQLYTVREIFGPDPMGTLEKVAKIGYREIEYGGGGYDKMDHAALRRTQDRLGLKAPSVHVPYEWLLADFNGAVKMAKTLGADTVILPYMTDQHRNEAGWNTALKDFNRFARDLKKAGLDFAYHNHDFEFTVKPGGVSLYDRLLKETDPALVKVELDLFWAITAGQDPAALIRRLAGRIYAYHVKDKRPDGSMCAVGEGKIDFGAIFKLNRVAGVKHFYVENDQCPAPYLPDITTSYRTLRALRF
ncbi:sugar phosphate isomerase/epimerase [Sphingomonas sp. BE138]|uniref:sugar phosphate isomerase/epimerase family protein n=1 Tax=Sphingomonas sp. BE138 TaxID=2817845 RepID=UPI0028654674|nr:sugar phosphate isomerase/epimerase [Sphingomonas sp. BE138]MDR6788345.1 sugar phosphate isomerase/epimerase [Sphingomonas sp. BE138]